jgi:hypothetical protein
MHEFHASDMDKGSRFRESLRFKNVWSSERLDRAQSLLHGALEKTGHESLTAHNFDKVMTHLRRDPGYHQLHSAGPEFESSLREHLGIPEEDQS